MTLILKPYQLEGIKFLKEDARCRYLADDPGLGKTIQCITAARELGIKSLLVVCPAAIVSQWQNQLGEFPKREVISYESIALSPHKPHDTNCMNAKEKPPLKKGDEPNICLACGYEYSTPEMIQRRNMAVLNRKRLKENGPYDLMVFDEAHALKEGGSNRTGYLLHGKYGIVQVAKKVFLLSATPVLNRHMELYTILKAFWPQAVQDCPTKQHFAYMFCDAQQGYNGSLDASGSSNADELGKRLQGFMLKRTVDVLGPDFPRLNIIENPVRIETVISKDEHVATRRRMTGEAKADLLVHNIKEIANQVGKLVVFYQHKSVLTALSRHFPYAPIIQGGLTSNQKAIQVERFTKLAQSPVMLVQLSAGGVGVDGLQHAANNGYIAELDWTPALLDQAIGRLRRLGQKAKVVNIYLPIGHKNGLDKHMHKMLAAKTEVISGVMGHVIKNVISELKKEHNMEALIPLLERIAEALENRNGLVEEIVRRGGEPNIAPATRAEARKKGKKSEDAPIPADAATYQQPEVMAQPAVKTMTHAEATQKISELLNGDPENVKARQGQYKEFISQYNGKGYKSLKEMPENELEGFINAVEGLFATPVGQVEEEFSV